PASLTLTISIGIATFTPSAPNISAAAQASLQALEPHFANLLKRADQALYEAKHAGRNCVKSAPWVVA
ncbi:MAG: hypothetical protein ACRDBI_07940, partial [Shewanella sp.]